MRMRWPMVVTTAMGGYITVCLEGGPGLSGDGEGWREKTKIIS